MTAETITHILEVSPRGFSNEVTVYPLTHEYVRRGQEVANHFAGETTGWAYCVPWAEATPKQRSAAGLLLRELDEKGLEDFLTHHLLGCFAFDPNAYDFVNGQWVTAGSDAVA